jgi:hypothetical protein
MDTHRERGISQTLRRMSTEDVAAWCESFREGSSHRVLGEMELQRRRDRAIGIRFWIAIGLSISALIVSSVTLYILTR